MSPPVHLARSCPGLLLGAMIALGGAWNVAAGGPGDVLTDIREIRALSPEQAMASRPVRVQGIITRITPHELFIQDGSDAIFIWQEQEHPDLRMGDHVEVSGISHSGHFVPVIREPVFTRLGHRGLPPPLAVRYGDLASGRSDCQWVEVSGVVRTLEFKPAGTLSLHLLFDGALLRVELHEPSADISAQLLGAQVRLRGVISGAKTPQRKILEPVLWVANRPDTFMVEVPGPADVFSLPLRAADTLLEHEDNSLSGEMVRVGGSVTSQPTPSLVFVRDQAQSLEIRLQQPVVFHIGDRIEAVGFPERGLVQSLLQSALARRFSAGPPPPPRRVAAGQLLDFSHEAELVEVEGELREIFRHNEGVVMLLAEKGQAFNVDVDAGLLAPPAELPPVGSRLALVGICSIDRLTPPDRFQIVAPASVRLRLRAMDDLTVLSRPPWWSPQRLLTAIALLSVLTLGALAWIWFLDRRVRAQTRIIVGSVRKEAMLEERNRIAREFHDSLEQQLAGATIMLDAIDTVLVEQPQRARDGLNTARAMLRHSLDEAQHAVADLRNNDLFERELGPLIEATVRERLRPTGIKAEFRREGVWPELDTMVKKHLLRIVQESVTNAIKHAAPTRITVALLAAADAVELRVQDDGCGFILEDRPRPGPGEFGLIGLQERAEKIGARLTILSDPRQGTTVAVALPRAIPAF